MFLFATNVKFYFKEEGEEKLLWLFPIKKGIYFICHCNVGKKCKKIVKAKSVTTPIS